MGMAVWFTTVEGTQSNEIDTKTFFFVCLVTCSRRCEGYAEFDARKNVLDLASAVNLSKETHTSVTWIIVRIQMFKQQNEGISRTILVQSAHDNEW